MVRAISEILATGDLVCIMRFESTSVSTDFDLSVQKPVMKLKILCESADFRLGE